MQLHAAICDSRSKLGVVAVVAKDIIKKDFEMAGVESSKVVWFVFKPLKKFFMKTRVVDCN